MYCEGEHCSKRDLCLLHKPVVNSYQEYLDWSTYGSGKVWTDETGSHVEIDHSCGDSGNFKHFEPLLATGIEIPYKEYVLNPGPEDITILKVNNEEYDIEEIDFSTIDTIMIKCVKFKQA